MGELPLAWQTKTTMDPSSTSSDGNTNTVGFIKSEWEGDKA